MAWPSTDPTSRDLNTADGPEGHRVALTRYCRSKLGSLDAEDAVQETFVRALHAVDRFEGRGSLRAWLYRIATNVCIDVLERRKRRARLMGFGFANESIGFGHG